MSRKKLFNDNQHIRRDTFDAAVEPQSDQASSTHSQPSRLCYAMDDENPVKRFELIEGGGKRYSFSYSILPTFILEDSSLLYIKAHELLVSIKGVNLDPIYQYLNLEQLLKLEASPSGKFDGKEGQPFIQTIEIKGETILTL